MATQAKSQPVALLNRTRLFRYLIGTLILLSGSGVLISDLLHLFY